MALTRQRCCAWFFLYLSVSPAFLATGYDSIHMVDLQKVMCPTDRGGQGYFDVELAATEISGDAGWKPHVVTFLRSANELVSISFTVLDANNVPWQQGDPKTVTLDYLGGRRLAGDEEEEGAYADAAEDDLFEDADAELDIEEAWDEDEAPIRHLATRRSTSSSSPSRRRAPTSSSPSRRRAPVTSPRRRGTGSVQSAPRRRGAPAPTGPRRRTSAVTPPNAPASHGRFQSASTGGTGYGYTSSSSMQSNYAGNYPSNSPSYGYSGTSSYGASGSGGKSSSMMYLGAGLVGGAAVGAGTYYMYHRLSSADCSGYSCCYGCSNSCYGQQARTCDMDMDRSYYRDDVMLDGGFYPRDMTLPLRVRISAVAGVGYDTNEICPSATCSAEDCANPSGQAVISDLYVTLTQLEELTDSLSADNAPRRAGNLARLPVAAASIAAAGFLLPWAGA